MKNKTLVAYFSAGGTTARLAETLAETANADLFEIQPKIPYTAADLNWTDKNSRTMLEAKDKNSRPEIAAAIENMSDYDTVFIGFPVWWYVAPAIINTFMESYDFSGKTIIPFATSGGSGLGKTVSVLKPLCSPGAVWKEGKVLNGRQTKESLHAWLSEIE